MNRVAMKLITLLSVISLLVANVFADGDLSSPKAAYLSYTNALVAGDLAVVKSASISTDKQSKMIAGMVAYLPIEKKFRETVIKAFPDAAKDLPDPSTLLLKSIDSATVKTEGDTATLITTQTAEPIKLKRVDGKWKIDLATMFNDDSVADLMLFRNSLAEVMTDLTADIESGKFKIYADLKSTLEMKVKMRIANPPDEEPTTKPGN